MYTRSLLEKFQILSPHPFWNHIIGGRVLFRIFLPVSVAIQNRTAMMTPTDKFAFVLPSAWLRLELAVLRFQDYLL